MAVAKAPPLLNLEDNTTWDSVADFEKIRELLQIEKWQVFGGSWGSTLGLAYAQAHPERVTELVLRGIFMLREKELKWFYQGPGASFIFPEDWAKYEAAIPPEERATSSKHTVSAFVEKWVKKKCTKLLKHGVSGKVALASSCKTVGIVFRISSARTNSAWPSHALKIITLQIKGSFLGTTTC